MLNLAAGLQKLPRFELFTLFTRVKHLWNLVLCIRVGFGMPNRMIFNSPGSGRVCHTEIIDPQLIWFESSRLLKHNILMIGGRVMSDNRNIIFAASIHSDETPPSESLFKFFYLFGDIWFWYGRGEHERRAESRSWICERIEEENFRRNAARDLWMCWLESGFPACHK